MSADNSRPLPVPARRAYTHAGLMRFVRSLSKLTRNVWPLFSSVLGWFSWF